MASERKPSIFILSLLVSFASVAAMLFTPALPQIEKELHLSSAQAQMTMTLFLLGYALGNLPYGPLSNKFGRKPTLFLGICIAILGSLIVSLVKFINLFWLFLLGRFLLAIGSAVGMKIAYTMVGDSFSKDEATHKIAYFLISFAFGPAIAMAIGGFLTNHFGWESCYYVLTAYSLFLLLLSTALPETCKILDPQSLEINKIKEAYSKKFKNKKLLLGATIMGCSTAIVYLFGTDAPFIGIDHIGLSSSQYGLLTLIPPFGMFLGAIFSKKLVGRMEMLNIILLGIIITFLSSLAMLLLFLLDIVTPLSLFLPMPFVFIGTSLVFANSSSLAMFHAQDKSTGSAVMNFINLGVTFIFLTINEFLPTHRVYIMPLLFIITIVAMVILRDRFKRSLDV